TESGAASRLSPAEIRPEELRVNEDALTSLEPQQRPLDVAGVTPVAKSLAAFAVPLVIDGRALGTLYLLGGAETLGIDATDFPVFGGVAAQPAIAFDRGG